MDPDTFLRKIYPESMFNDDKIQEDTSANAPFITLTYAQSLDAMIAGKAGKQIILSGKESMGVTHRWVACALNIKVAELSGVL